MKTSMDAANEALFPRVTEIPGPTINGKLIDFTKVKLRKVQPSTCLVCDLIDCEHYGISREEST